MLTGINSMMSLLAKPLIRNGVSRSIHHSSGTAVGKEDGSYSFHTFKLQ